MGQAVKSDVSNQRYQTRVSGRPRDRKGGFSLQILEQRLKSYKSLKEQFNAHYNTELTRALNGNHK